MREKNKKVSFPYKVESPTLTKLRRQNGVIFGVGNPAFQINREQKPEVQDTPVAARNHNRINPVCLSSRVSSWIATTPPPGSNNASPLGQFELFVGQCLPELKTNGVKEQRGQPIRQCSSRTPQNIVLSCPESSGSKQVTWNSIMDTPNNKTSSFKKPSGTESTESWVYYSKPVLPRRSTLTRTNCDSLLIGHQKSTEIKLCTALVIIISLLCVLGIIGSVVGILYLHLISKKYFLDDKTTNLVSTVEKYNVSTEVNKNGIMLKTFPPEGVQSPDTSASFSKSTAENPDTTH
ncbi:uncharacterized protein LOC143257588 [Tachypleus tridentatus]|uniref:uncharacterized protein LOC143257588 n=1 Tax=Tachypleus tridentatus TaxID=6853 RepID=UPI003FD2E312